MSKHDAAPTHGWVISSQINKWLALTFMVFLLVAGIGIWTVRYTINRDCDDTYARDLRIGSYWIQVEAGSTKPGCPRNDD